MSNQYTNGRIKPYLEGIPKTDLKGVSSKLLEKHYEQQGYIKGTLTVEDHGAFPVLFYLDRINTGKGYRYYLLCNNCGRRVTYLLYVPREKDDHKYIALGCRHCFDVNYMVQQTTRSENDYHFYKLRQIGKKLDPNFNPTDLVYSWPPFKPKWMKQVTYDKYRHQFFKHQQAAHYNWISGAEKILNMKKYK